MCAAEQMIIIEYVDRLPRNVLLIRLIGFFAGRRSLISGSGFYSCESGMAAAETSPLGGRTEKKRQRN